MKTGKIISNYILQYFCSSHKENILQRIVGWHASVKSLSTLYVLQITVVLRAMVACSFLSNGTHSLHKEHF